MSSNLAVFIFTSNNMLSSSSLSKQCKVVSECSLFYAVRSGKVTGPTGRTEFAVFDENDDCEICCVDDVAWQRVLEPSGKKSKITKPSCRYKIADHTGCQ